MFEFFKQKIEEKKKADLLEKEILSQLPSSQENEEFLWLTRKLKGLKGEVPIFLPKINFETQKDKKLILTRPFPYFRPLLVGVGIILIFLTIFLPNFLSPKFSGLNKKAIAKEKEFIEKQILIHKETEKKAQVILKNL